MGGGDTRPGYQTVLYLSYALVEIKWTLFTTSHRIQLMKQIAAAKFKEQCLSILDNVGAEGIVITKHGKPVAKLIRIGAESASLIGALKGRLTIRGEILTTGAKWHAES